MSEHPKSEATAHRMLARYHEQLEAEFVVSRKNASEELWNAFATVIKVQNPSVETILYVIEMMRSNVIALKLRENFSPGARLKPVETLPTPDENGHLDASHLGALELD